MTVTVTVTAAVGRARGASPLTLAALRPRAAALGRQVAPALCCRQELARRAHTAGAAGGGCSGLAAPRPPGCATRHRAATAAQRRGGGETEGRGRGGSAHGARSPGRRHCPEVGASSPPCNPNFVEPALTAPTGGVTEWGFVTLCFPLVGLCLAPGVLFLPPPRLAPSGWVSADLAAELQVKLVKGEETPTWVPSNFPARESRCPPLISALLLSLQMSGMLVIAAWCFLQVESRHPEIITSNSNHGNFLDNDKWLSTVSQYDRDKYWNKFRDVSTFAFTTLFLFVLFDCTILSMGGCWLIEAVGRKRHAALNRLLLV